MAPYATALAERARSGVRPVRRGQIARGGGARARSGRGAAPVGQRERRSAPRRGWSTPSGARRRASISIRTAAAPRCGRRSASGSASPPSPSWSATAPTSSWPCWRAAALDPGDEVLIPHPAFEPYGTEATLSGATVVREPAHGLRPGSRRHARPRHAADEVRDPLHPAQPGRHHRAAPAARALPRLARRRSAARDPRRGVPGLLRRRRHRGRRGAPAALPDAALAADLLQDRGAGRAARGLRDRAAGAHRAVEPGAGAVQRQPPRPRSRRWPRSATPSTSSARAAWCWSSGRGCRPRWPSAARRHPPRRPTSSWPGRASGRGRCAAALLQAGHPGARRRGRGLPRAPAHRGGDRGAERAAARGVGPDQR